MILLHWKGALATVLCLAAFSQPGLAQMAPPTILELDIENFVAFYDDIPDVSKRATDPNATMPVLGRNFAPSVLIGDIVAVNGQPAKGTFVYRTLTLNLRTAPTAGQAIADIVRNNVNNQAFEILKSDGTPIGTIMTVGLGVGSAPPGAPLAVTQGNNAIVGGTGVFLGARGQVGQTVQTTAARLASMSEDPANRRRYGGGKTRFALHVIPMFRPEVVATATGPAVTHSSDFSLVTASKPAAAGEILAVFLTGLGPTVPGVDPGKPFPASPLAAVNSPVDVTVNGKSAEVTAAVGYPGAVDGYQVNFRVPADTAKGAATVQVTAAWIAGPSVNI